MNARMQRGYRSRSDLPTGMLAWRWSRAYVQGAAQQSGTIVREMRSMHGGDARPMVSK